MHIAYLPITWNTITRQRSMGFEYCLAFWTEVRGILPFFPARSTPRLLLVANAVLKIGHTCHVLYINVILGTDTFMNE